jgi:hypothetical protein
MRWTDLPPDREPADAGASVLSRGEWDDLRRRLERLPPGHPSRPGDEGEVQAQDGRADQRRPADEGEDQAKEKAADQDRAGERGSPGWRGVKDDGAGRPREPGGHRERDAGPLLPGRREPYRPWFTAGEQPEPWFAADPDPAAGP